MITHYDNYKQIHSTDSRLLWSNFSSCCYSVWNVSLCFVRVCMCVDVTSLSTAMRRILLPNRIRADNDCDVDVEYDVFLKLHLLHSIRCVRVCVLEGGTRFARRHWLVMWAYVLYILYVAVCGRAARCCTYWCLYIYLFVSICNRPLHFICCYDYCEKS